VVVVGVDVDVVDAVSPILTPTPTAPPVVGVDVAVEPEVEDVVVEVVLPRSLPRRISTPNSMVTSDARKRILWMPIWMVRLCSLKLCFHL
jgi:hypothetical protein